MSRLGIVEAFARYDATLRNPQWSVSAWTPDDELVVSIWQHHFRRGESGSMTVADSFARWRGAGNNEFRANLAKALAGGHVLRLVIVTPVRAEDTARVQAGADASGIPKEFDVREDLVGQVVAIDDDEYTMRFAKRMTQSSRTR